jgi:hypothetical protein
VRAQPRWGAVGHALELTTGRGSTWLSCLCLPHLFPHIPSPAAHLTRHILEEALLHIFATRWAGSSRLGGKMM